MCAPGQPGLLALNGYHFCSVTPLPAADAEEQRNFEHFLKHGVEEQAGLTYRFLIASGEGILVSCTHG